MNMANELYYDYITESLQTFKTTIDEAIIEVLPRLDKELYISPQTEIMNYIDDVILDSDIEKFSENMNYYLMIREGTIKNYHGKRDKQIAENNPKLIQNRYLVVGSKKKSTNETFERAMAVDSFKTESTILHLIKQYPDLLLPKNTDISDIEISYAVNTTTFHDPEVIAKSTKKFVTLDDPNRYLQQKPEYIVISRVKKSKRELEKFVDYLLGIRTEFHYDSIATHEIVPREKFYENIEQIHTISDSTPFKADYRPKGILLPFYKKENLHNIIIEGSKLAGKYSITHKEVTPKDKDTLLAGVWIDHHFNKMRIETILQIQEFFDWYKGVLGHDAHYHKEREENRLKSHKNKNFYIYKHKSDSSQSITLTYNLNHVAKHLEDRFSMVYELE
jgi:hypothetical protein